MLSLSLLSLTLLAAALLAMWRGGWWMGLFFAIGVLSFVIAVGGNGSAEQICFLQFIVLVPIVAILRRLPRLRKWLGVVLPISITLALHVSFYREVEDRYRRYLHLIELYPLESMEACVRVPPADLRPPPLSEAAPDDLFEQEYYTDQAGGWEGHERTYRLKLLHDATVESFQDAANFGVRRNPVVPESVFLLGVRNHSAVHQPVVRSAPPEPSELRSPWPTVTTDEKLRTFHFQSVADFSYPAGSGYAKDRAHVAGFRPHEFSQLPQPSERWDVETVDLVSLLCHPEPVAYVSANLPRMQDLKEVSTRPLDAFESAGLTKLKGGDFLVVGQVKQHLRLFGAIRAVRQCVTCHGCERGDLLGAFSYTLRRTGP